MRVWNNLRGLLVLAIWFVGCRSGVSSSTDGNTHFLEPCTTTCSGGLECICGICTRGCSSAGDCGNIAAQASCIAASEAHPDCSEGKPKSVCDVPCRSNADCSALTAAPVCTAGHCRANAADAGATPSDGGRTDATSISPPDGGGPGGDAGAVCPPGVDTSGDPTNCGACGNVCAPVTLASEQTLGSP